MKSEILINRYISLSVTDFLSSKNAITVTNYTTTCKKENLHGLEVGQVHTFWVMNEGHSLNGEAKIPKFSNFWLEIILLFFFVFLRVAKKLEPQSFWPTPFRSLTYMPCAQMVWRTPLFDSRVSFFLHCFHFWFCN